VLLPEKIGCFGKRSSANTHPRAQMSME
jgi:hypothetical protein